MPDHGGVGDALVKRLRKLGVEVLAIDGAARRRGARATARGLDGGRSDPRRVLAARARRRGRRSRSSTRPTGARRCACGSSCSPSPCASSDQVEGQARSWSPPPGSAAATATTPPARTSVLGGAVTGFTKALARERPDALVKAVDFAAGAQDRRRWPTSLIEETLRDPGAVEIGHADGLRWTRRRSIERRRPRPTRRAR